MGDQHQRRWQISQDGWTTFTACVQSTLHKRVQPALVTKPPWGRSAHISPAAPRAMTNSSQAAAAKVTVPVVEATRLGENGAAPSTQHGGNTGYPGDEENGRRSCDDEDYRDGGCCDSDNASLVEGVAEPLRGCTSSRCWLEAWNIEFRADRAREEYYSWVVYRYFFVVFAESEAYVQDGVVSIPPCMKYFYSAWVMSAIIFNPLWSANYVFYTGNR